MGEVTKQLEKQLKIIKEIEETLKDGFVLKLDMKSHSLFIELGLGEEERVYFQHLNADSFREYRIPSFSLSYGNSYTESRAIAVETFSRAKKLRDTCRFSIYGIEVRIEPKSNYLIEAGGESRLLNDLEAARLISMSVRDSVKFSISEVEIKTKNTLTFFGS